MTYAQDEASTEDATPVELYEFTGYSATYRYTSAEEDVQFDSGAGVQTFTAIPISRNSVSADDRAAGKSLVVSLPVDTTLARTEVLQIGYRGLQLTVWRMHRASGFSAGIWKGKVVGWNIKGRMVALNVPNKYAQRMNDNLPRLQYQPYCNNVLFDSVCQRSRLNFTEPTTLDVGTGISTDGKTLTLSSIGITAKYETVGWADGGDIVHDATGERRMIISHNDVVIKIMQPFNGVVANGDAVTVYAGCNHSLDHCVNKFTNWNHFNGMPFLITQSVVTAKNGG